MKDIKTFWQILEANSSPTHFNLSFNNLNRELVHLSELEDRSYSVVSQISKVLSQYGQKKFIHLGSGFREAMVAIALYCGNGLVAKVIPSSCSDNLPDIVEEGKGRAMFLLPSIRSIDVKGNSPVCDFKIKYYPFIANSNITKEDVEGYRKKIKNFGLDIKDGDEKLINFKRLPDKNGTIVGIDADMLYTYDRLKFEGQEEEIFKWLNHLQKLFPIYNSKEIYPQNSNTDFSFESMLACKEAKFLDYNNIQKAESKKELGWLGRFF